MKPKVFIEYEGNTGADCGMFVVRGLAGRTQCFVGTEEELKDKLIEALSDILGDVEIVARRSFEDEDEADWWKQ